MSDPLEFCGYELDELERLGLRRRVRTLETAQGPVATIDGREYVVFASNNYLDLAADPRVIEAAREAATRWGAGAGSARLVVGTMQIHRDLERDLATFKGTEDTVLFSSGYLANLALATLLRPGDAVFSDALNHACIVDACRLSRADVHVYPHRDVEAAARQLREWRRHHKDARALLVTDSVFSMDGDIAPLEELAALCEQHGAMFMVDEAHATGVVGPGGRGAVAAHGLTDRVHVLMGTLSKSLGAAGGFLAGSRAVCELLRNRARPFMFDTAPPPPTVAAARAALAILRSEEWRVDHVRKLMTQLCATLDLPCPSAAILPIVVGDPRLAVEMSDRAREVGLLVPAIRPPAVPPGSARLRITLTAGHTEAQIERLATASFWKHGRTR